MKNSAKSRKGSAEFHSAVSQIYNLRSVGQLFYTYAANNRGVLPCGVDPKQPATPAAHCRDSPEQAERLAGRKVPNRRAGKVNDPPGNRAVQHG